MLFLLLTYGASPSSTPHPTASGLSALPLFLPALCPTEPSSSPSFLRAPLRLRDSPDFGAQRDGGQGVDLVRSGGAPAEMEPGPGSDQLQQVSVAVWRWRSRTSSPSAFLSLVFESSCTCGTAY